MFHPARSLHRNPVRPASKKSMAWAGDDSQPDNPYLKKLAAVYFQRIYTPKGMSVPQSIVSQPGDISLIRATFPGMSREDHAQHALVADQLRVQVQKEYHAAIQAAVKAYGDHGSLISGVYRDHFPAAVKDKLRHMARADNALGSISHAHGLAAGVTAMRAAKGSKLLNAKPARKNPETQVLVPKSESNKLREWSLGCTGLTAANSQWKAGKPVSVSVAERALAELRQQESEFAHSVRKGHEDSAEGLEIVRARVRALTAAIARAEKPTRKNPEAQVTVSKSEAAKLSEWSLGCTGLTAANRQWKSGKSADVTTAVKALGELKHQEMEFAYSVRKGHAENAEGLKIVSARVRALTAAIAKA